MKTEIKTTIYDIFGYLMPGYLLLAFLFVAFNFSTPGYDVLSQLTARVAALDLYNAVLLTVAAYLLGHILSAMSGFLVETLLCKIPMIGDMFGERALLDKKLWELFLAKYKQLFQYKSEGDVYRLLSCYVEAKQPAVYATAFVFLAIYGMSRNFSLLVFIFAAWVLVGAIMRLDVTLFLYFVISFGTSALLFYNYLRFRQNFCRQLLHGFILKEDGSDKPRRSK